MLTPILVYLHSAKCPQTLDLVQLIRSGSVQCLVPVSAVWTALIDLRWRLYSLSAMKSLSHNICTQFTGLNPVLRLMRLLWGWWASAEGAGRVVVSPGSHQIPPCGSTVACMYRFFFFF